MTRFTQGALRSREPMAPGVEDSSCRVHPALTAALFLLLFQGASPAAPNWPQFRGPGGSGVAVDGDIPTRFGPTVNVAWKTPLPPGHSSPCIFGEKIFLTGFAEDKLETLCLHRRDGRILWKRAVAPGEMERGSGLSSPASPTPATDGERVYVYFGSFGLIAYDFSGNERWRKPLPTPITQHGASTSPVLAGDRLILSRDQDVGSYLLAVDRLTGKTVWKTERPGFRRGFSSPLVWPRANPQLVILAGTLRLTAYDLEDGSERWMVRGLPNEMVSTPVSGSGLIFAAGWTHGSGVERMPEFASLLEKGDGDGDGRLSRDEASGPARQHFTYIDADKDGWITQAEWDPIAKIFDKSENVLLAVDPGGRGDVTETHVVWKQKRGLPYVPSPLHYDGRVFIVKNGGIASCFDAKTGKVHYLEKRTGAFGRCYASPVAANGKICVASHNGVVVVLRAADELEVLSRNDFKEAIMATPAIAEDTLYLRTKGFLYAFGSTSAAGGRE